MEVLTGLIKEHLLSDAITRFIRLRKLSGKWTKKTTGIFETHLAYFQEWAPKTLEEIDSDKILEYLDEAGKGRKRDKNGVRIPAPYQKQQSFRILKAFFNWCEDNQQGYIVKSPMHKMEIGAPIDRVHIPPSQDEIKLILDYFDNSYLGKRNRAIFYLYCNTGARLCEILTDFSNDKPGMLASDIFWETKEIRILGKGNRERLVSIEPVTLKAMADYEIALDKRARQNGWPNIPEFWRTEEGKPLQGDGFSELLRRMRKHIQQRTGKVIDLTSHDLRRRVVTLAREAGLNTEEIMSITGHKTSKMVLLYSKTYDSKKARTKLSLHSPVAGL